MKNGRKICAGLLIGGVVASAGLFAGCGGDADAEVLSKTSDVYGFAGATTSMLASDDAVINCLSKVETNDVGDAFALLKSQLQTAITSSLDEYMGMFDTVVGGNNPVSTVTEDLQEGEYAHKMTITTTNSKGDTRTVYFYFNETLTNGTKVNDTDDEDRETVIDGKLVAGDLTLYVAGEKEVESNETEVEFRVSLTKNDTQNYVKFSQEHENGEEEYYFAIVKNGTVLTGSEFKLDLEKNDDGSLDLEYESLVNGSEASFNIKKTANNQIQINTNLFEHDLTIIVSAIQESGQVKYNYSIAVGELFTFDFDGNFQLI